VLPIPVVGTSTAACAPGRLSCLFKTSVELRLENLALRHQLGVLRRSAPKRLKLMPADRILWVGLRRVSADWKSTLLIVKPETVIAWQSQGFRLYWTWKVFVQRRLA